MTLAVVGLSHHTAPVEVRERFVFGSRAAATALGGLVESGAVDEAVLLSTCNRTEVYVAAGRDAAGGPGAGAGAAPDPLAVVSRVLRERAGMGAAELEEHVYVHHDRRAARHLFRVASSLDSMVLGEAEIQGQVKRAYEDAARLEPAVAGPVLSRLFETALSVGGAVRAETSLGAGAASVPSAAVELAKKIFGPLGSRRALVLGAGEMSELALECFATEGVESVVVANRTTERAEAVAERVAARAVRFDELSSLLGDAEIIIAATSAPHPVLTRELLERAVGEAPEQPLLIVDIALPRDVEPSIGELERVFLYDIDDLQQIVESNVERRRGEIPAAESIIAEAVDGYWDWYRARDVAPLIRSLRGRTESVRRAEVEKALNKLQHLDPADREAVERLTRQLLNKVLHEPTIRLRQAASNGRGAAVVDAARYLFGLGEDSDAPVESERADAE